MVEFDDVGKIEVVLVTVEQPGAVVMKVVDVMTVATVVVIDVADFVSVARVDDVVVVEVVDGVLAVAVVQIDVVDCLVEFESVDVPGDVVGLEIAEAMEADVAAMAAEPNFAAEVDVVAIEVADAVVAKVEL